jgi:hypothetical protein
MKRTPASSPASREISLTFAPAHREQLTNHCWCATRDGLPRGIGIRIRDFENSLRTSAWLAGARPRSPQMIEKIGGRDRDRTSDPPACKAEGENTKVLRWCRLHGQSTKFSLSKCPEVAPSRPGWKQRTESAQEGKEQDKKWLKSSCLGNFFGTSTWRTGIRQITSRR